MQDRKLAVHFSSLRLDWSTPQAVFECDSDKISAQVQVGIQPVAQITLYSCKDHVIQMIRTVDKLREAKK